MLGDPETVLTRCATALLNGQVTVWGLYFLRFRSIIWKVSFISFHTFYIIEFASILMKFQLIGEGVGTSNFTTTTGTFFHYIKSLFLVDHYYDITTSKMAFEFITTTTKKDFWCSDFTYGIKKDHNVKNQNINYLWHITYGYQGLWGPGGLG